ncbi:MAG: peptide-methionine (S)-S-oxide reductase MsrA [Bauldia sp.]|nr:peptide-methionine (S)-S-oxide reductase MsrA [Bauldia sp.]
MPSTSIAATSNRRRNAFRLGGSVLVLAAGIAAVTAVSPPAEAAGEFWILPAAEYDPPTESTYEVAILAGGCFWGVQAVYQFTEGVISAVSGYSGGSAEDAEYYAVGSGRTGHAEAVEVVYDPQVISYAEILRIFFSVVHDPTQLDRQGPDFGPQYRSHIYFTTDEQREVAEAYIAQLGEAEIWADPIVTRLDPLEAFYPAEDYHQDYLLLHPGSAYIQIHDMPKLANFSRLFPEHFRSDPATVAETHPDLV